ncbi:MAG: mechanosensitive ion channel family protein [Acidimicrobiales bacterium]
MILQADPEQVEDVCGADSSFWCEKMLDWTDNEVVARIADWFVDKPVKILFIFAAAVVLNRLLRRGIAHLVERIAAGSRPEPGSERRGRRRWLPRAPAIIIPGEASVRSAARAKTVAGVLRSAGSIVIYSLAVLISLGELNINLGPLIAGAGIAGVAIGFGAQSLVKDFLSGVFMLIEDQYGVGDVVDLGEAVGTVEEITLRITRLRDVNGTVWYVPNGQILRVANKSQQWARAVLDIGVAYGTDIEHAERVIKRVADEVWQDDAWSDKVLEEPEVWGVENLAADSVVIRLVVKTEPASQWNVMRELRRRLKDAFDEAGIEIPFPQRTMWIRQEPAPVDAEGNEPSP